MYKNNKKIDIHISAKLFELTEQEFWESLSPSRNDPNICLDGDLKGNQGTKGFVNLQKKF